jgi:hypothetical protein
VNAEDEEEEGAPPMIGMNRSLSVLTGDEAGRNKDQQERIENLRKWIDSYQRWKEWLKDDEQDVAKRNLYDDSYSPLESVIAFLCSKAETQKLEECLEAQTRRCANRIVGFQAYNLMLEVVQGTYLERYYIGTLTEVFKDSCLVNINCVDQKFKELLLEQVHVSLQRLIVIFNQKYERIHKINISNITSYVSKIKNGVKIAHFESTIIEYLKNILQNISEIFTLLCNPYVLGGRIWGDTELDESDLSDAKRIYSTPFVLFLKNLINISLLAKCFMYLSNNFEMIVTLSNNIIHNCLYIFTNVVDNLRSQSHTA